MPFEREPFSSLSTAPATAVLVLSGAAPGQAVAQMSKKSVTAVLSEGPEGQVVCNADCPTVGRAIRGNVVEALPPNVVPVDRRLATMWFAEIYPNATATVEARMAMFQAVGLNVKSKMN